MEEKLKLLFMVFMVITASMQVHPRFSNTMSRRHYIALKKKTPPTSIDH